MPGCGLLIGSTSRYSHGGHDVVPRAPTAAAAAAWHLAETDNIGWSRYGAPWLQLVATGRKSDRRGNRKIKPTPLPPAATGCLRRSMVRRGSTVRVRQRAWKKALQMGMLCCL